jgi:hypothetical protein
LRGANNVVDSNPARVKAREEVQDLFLKTLNIEAHVRSDVMRSNSILNTLNIKVHVRSDVMRSNRISGLF